ncbi:MAG: glycosyltransferase family 4 protein [Desulfovibrio sp.]|nr:glycosyltransferase family 4 protein [Desulfovibrio sp.]
MPLTSGLATEAGEQSGRQSVPPVIAYVLLWFPLSSETFIFREVVQLRQRGLPVFAYSMYGENLKGCSEEMLAFDGPVRRMGIKATCCVLAAFGRALRQKPRAVWRLMREGFFRRMRNVEALGENIWCFLAGFLLAEQCREDGVQLIHAAWANGPATAAWVASRVTGIPFAFTGRAGDIYPEDGLLREKSRDALFIRTNNRTNVQWLRKFCPPDATGKVHAIYNSLTFRPCGQCAMPMQAPYRLLAVGRFARTKGFPELLTAMARLRREQVPVTLTLVGDGNWHHKLVKMRDDLGLAQVVDMPGFIPHDKICSFMLDYDMLIMPSVVHSNGDRDGIPNVIMEALSHRMPVIATDVCGIAEVIIDGETGLLVPQRDPRALADAVRRMVSDRNAALAMAEAGRAHVEKLFDPTRNITAVYDLYVNECARAALNQPEQTACFDQDCTIKEEA